MARLSVVFLLALISLAVSWALSQEPAPIRLLVSPRGAFSPVDVFVTVRIVPAEANRAVMVWMDGIDFYRSSAWTLDGAAGPRVFSVTWRAVPAGEYVVRAELVALNRRWQASLPVQYLSRAF